MALTYKDLRPGDLIISTRGQLLWFVIEVSNQVVLYRLFESKLAVRTIIVYNTSGPLHTWYVVYREGQQVCKEK